LAVLQRKNLTARCWRAADQFESVEQESASILDELGLSVAADEVVRHIAYGQQRLTELALALALSPGVLLLDEPAEGIPHSESGLILSALQRLPREIAILMVEHDMDLVFRSLRASWCSLQGN
jgi:branched-chain amino acid transport system ATP-binding protein